MRPVSSPTNCVVGKGLVAGERIVMLSGQTGLSPGVKVAVRQGAPGQLDAKEPEIGPEGVGSTGVNTAPAGAGGISIALVTRQA